VKTILIDPDIDESQMDLLNNKTLANPTNRQASSTVKSEMLLEAKPAGYSLRSNRRRVNYRERSESMQSSIHDRKMSVSS
jgi:hypothetical protein